jgi:uncharacterized membrane protein
MKKPKQTLKGMAGIEARINAAWQGLSKKFEAGPSARYSFVSSMAVIFLSSLAISYYIYCALQAGDFDVLDFIGKNTGVESPGLLTGILAAVFVFFMSVLYADKNRVSVLMHHVFSFFMLAYFFTGVNRDGWAEYNNTLMITAQSLLLALYAGWLAEKLFRPGKKAAAFIENKSAYFLAAFLIFYFLYFCRLALERHYMFYSQTYDLAWEHQVLHMLSFTGFPHSTIESIPGINNWGDHSSFIYYLLAPFYRLYPRVEFMLVLQPLAAAGAGGLFYLYAKKILKSGLFGAILAIALLMHPSVQGYMLEDFHPTVLALPLFFGFLIFAENKNLLGTLITFSLLAIVREDMAFFSFFAALYALASKKVSPGRGVMLGAISLAAIALALWVMHASGGGVYSEKRFYTMENSFAGVLEAVVANPLYVFSQAFDIDKINFLVVISAPLLFLFIFDGAAWIMLVPACIFGVFSKYLPHYILGYHYTVMFMCAAFTGAAACLGRKKPSVLVIAAILAMAVLMNYYYGNMFSKSYRLVCTGALLTKDKPDYINKGWTGLYREVRGIKDPEAENIMRSIPENYRVCADFFAASHVSGRRYIYQISGFNYADVVINRRGLPAFPGYVLIKSTVLWDFYAKKNLVTGGKAGIGPDGKAFFR